MFHGPHVGPLIDPRDEGGGGGVPVCLLISAELSLTLVLPVVANPRAPSLIVPLAVVGQREN